VIYRIDSDDRLTYADGAFHRFAYAAGVPDLAEQWYGRSLWHCIGDDELRALFVALVARARGGRTVRVSTRCDSPSLARSERSTVPVVTHGICDGCLAETAAELDPAAA